MELVLFDDISMAVISILEQPLYSHVLLSESDEEIQSNPLLTTGSGVAEFKKFTQMLTIRRELHYLSG